MSFLDILNLKESSGITSIFRLILLLLLATRIKYLEEFRQYEREARENQRGLWGLREEG